MSKRSSLFAFFILLLSVNMKAQRFSEGGLGFVKHLENISAYKESLLFLKKYEQAYGESDTTFLYQGRASYFVKDYNQSILYFDQVSENDIDYWNQAQFYAGWQSVRVGDLESAKDYFQNVTSEKSIRGLKSLELAGLCLLTGDMPQYEQYISNLANIGFEYKTHYEALEFVHERIVNRKQKSPLIAGLMSAAIPGAGKFYNGKAGQGSLSFITSAIMGMQAYEGFRKDGVESARFIIFSSLFSVFYVANIWGSVVGVRVDSMQFNQENYETVLLHMHIPIRLRYN
ncbi:MAG: hypothetical protein RIC35_21300 [Marinoscillum sp.]